MLSKKRNFIETIRGGNPDRYVNQYEFLHLLQTPTPINAAAPMPAPGNRGRNLWGVTVEWKEGQPGPMPLHGAENNVVKDIREWRAAVTMPRTDYPDSAWEACAAEAGAVDRGEFFVAPFVAPGVFETLHYLMGMEECFVNFYEHPAEMKELIDFITEYELKAAAGITKHLKPDAVFHHDDWGAHTSSFLSPQMFAEFLTPAYKKIYGFYKENGVEIIVHHSDSFAANLVPQMIEMGVDVWQGCVTSNDVPALVREFGGRISFMGDLNNGVLDKADWDKGQIRKEVERACRENGGLYFIPCLTMGGPWSIYPGVYDAVSEAIAQTPYFRQTPR